MNAAPGSANVGNVGGSYQHSPIPGNPTPPLTPYMSPPYGNQPDVKPDLSELKPVLLQSKTTKKTAILGLVVNNICYRSDLLGWSVIE